MDVRCQCGDVSFKTPIPKPLAIYICHCADCRRQSSSAFGTSAIFPAFRVPNAERLGCYARPTSSGHTLYCYFCKSCGTRLIHAASGKNVVSVKGGCVQGLDWKRAIHIWTKSAMVPIPEDSESHSGESDRSTDYGCDQEMLDQPSGPGASVAPDDDDLAYKPLSGACELSGF